MSDQDKIEQTVKEVEYAATSATGYATINVYNYYPREDTRISPVRSDKTAPEEKLSCPYRGLFHFRPNDTEFFFGREDFVEKLFEATKTRHFIPVLGASGSGKSSVVFAGLVPKLQQEGYWKFTHFRPGEGDDPFYALALALVPLFVPELVGDDKLKETRKIAESLCDGVYPLSYVFAEIQHNYPDERVLLIIDQFEELYTLCPDVAIRHNFLDKLITEIQPPLDDERAKRGVVLVLTLRADFLGNALSYRPFADMLQGVDIKLGAMNREELSQVIEEPAKKLGVEYEEGLVERILDDVEKAPGNLALLEFALTELWKEKKDNKLTHKAYKKIGGAKGALAQYAEKEYKKLKPKEKDRVQQIFIQLVHLGEDNNDTRRRINRNQIEKESWDLVTRKYGLADSRLVVTNCTSADSETLELVHDSLIFYWERLRDWLNKDRENLSKYRLLEDEAKQWENSKKKSDYLLSKKRLREAKDFQKKSKIKYSLSELAESYITRSVRHQRIESIKYWVLFGPPLFILLIFFLSGGVSGLYYIFREIKLNPDRQLIESCAEQKNCHGRLEALERLVKAGEDLTLYDLRGADLRGADLRGADLRSGDFTGVTLTNADLTNANLYGTNLVNANLSGSNLTRANLTGANLINANLSGSNLTGAYLTGANLINSNLDDANLSHTFLEHTRINENTQLNDKWRVVWEIVNLGAIGRDLSDTDLRDVSLIRANLERANLERADLEGAFLPGVNLEKANLERANLARVYTSSANFARANLKRASLEGASLSEANFEGANLEEANLQRANLEEANLQEVNFNGTNIEKANLLGAYIVNAQNLNYFQIKSACYWEKAFYIFHYDEEKLHDRQYMDQLRDKFIQDNKLYIDQLKQDKASDPQEPFVCKQLQSMQPMPNSN